VASPEALIDLLVDDLCARPLDQIVGGRAAAARWVAIVRAACESDAAVTRLTEPVLLLVEAHEDDTRRLRELLPPAVAAAAEDLAEHRFTPSPKVVSRLLASEPVKDFLRDLLAESIDAATSKLKLPLVPMGGLVGLGKSAAGKLLDVAMDALMARLVESIADPKQHKQQAALRRALTESVLALRTRDVAREVPAARPEEIARILRRHAHAWSLEAGAVDDVEQAILLGLGGDRGRPLGEALEAWGVYHAVRGAMHEALGELLLPFLRSPAFQKWLSS
jgi:hypothetical protein